MVGLNGILAGICLLATATTIVATIPCDQLPTLKTEVDKFRADEFAKAKTKPTKLECIDNLGKEADKLIELFFDETTRIGASANLENKKPPNTFVAFAKFDRTDAIRAKSPQDVAIIALQQWQDKGRYDGEYYNAVTYSTNTAFGIGTKSTVEKEYVLALFQHEPVVAKTEQEWAELTAKLDKLPSADDPSMDKLKTEIDKTAKLGYSIRSLNTLRNLDYKADLLKLETRRGEMAKKHATGKMPQNEINELYRVQLQISWMSPLHNMEDPADLYTRITVDYVCGVVQPDTSFRMQLNRLLQHAVNSLKALQVKVPPNANPGDQATFDFRHRATHRWWLFDDPNAGVFTLTQILHTNFCHFDDQAGAIIDDIILADNEQIAKGLKEEKNSAAYKMAFEALEHARVSTATAKATLLDSARAALLNDVNLITGGYSDVLTKTVEKPLECFNRGMRVRIAEDRMLDYCLLQRPIAYEDLNKDGAVCKNEATPELLELKLKCAATLQNNPDWKTFFQKNKIDKLETDVTAYVKDNYNTELLQKPSFARALAVRYCNAKDVSTIAKTVDQMVKAEEKAWKTTTNLPDDIKSWISMMRQFIPGFMETTGHLFENSLEDQKAAARKAFSVAWASGLQLQREMAALLAKKLTPKSKKDIVVTAFLFCKTIRPYSFVNGLTKTDVCDGQYINTDIIAYVECAKTAVRHQAPAGTPVDLTQFEFSHYLIKSICRSDAIFKKLWLWRAYSFKGFMSKETYKKDVQQKFSTIISLLKDVERFWKERAEDAVKLSEAGQPK